MPYDQKKIVEAIRQGDGDAAYKAALDHVASASAIAEAVLIAQKTGKD